jgi:hypothetical protein
MTHQHPRAFSFTRETAAKGCKSAMAVQDQAGGVLGVLYEMDDGTYVFWRTGAAWYQSFRTLPEVFEFAAELKPYEP